MPEQPDIQPHHLYTIPKTAQILNLSKQTIRDAVKAGRLRSVKLTPTSLDRVPGMEIMAVMNGEKRI